jgi:hypothetical protein
MNMACMVADHLGPCQMHPLTVCIHVDAARWWSGPCLTHNYLLSGTAIQGGSHVYKTKALQRPQGARIG